MLVFVVYFLIHEHPSLCFVLAEKVQGDAGIPGMVQGKSKGNIENGYELHLLFELSALDELLCEVSKVIESVRQAGQDLVLN